MADWKVQAWHRTAKWTLSQESEAIRLWSCYREPRNLKMQDRQGRLAHSFGQKAQRDSRNVLQLLCLIQGYQVHTEFFRNSSSMWWSRVKSLGMLGQVGRLGRSPGGSNAFPSDFFNALNRGDSKEAVSTVRGQFRFTPEGAPSSRAQEMVDNGEWDAKQSDLLRCLDGSNCAAEIPGGRFCGKRKCITAAHKKAKGVVPGWYFAMTPKCFWAEPWSPTDVDRNPSPVEGQLSCTQIRSRSMASGYRVVA
jgi:hypothetical protein